MDNQEVLPCADKLAFESRDQASVGANVAAYQHGITLQPYKCRYCELWHLSSRGNSLDQD